MNRIQLGFIPQSLDRAAAHAAVRKSSQDMYAMKEGEKREFPGNGGLFQAGAHQTDYLSSADQVIPAWLAAGDIPRRG